MLAPAFSTSFEVTAAIAATLTAEGFRPRGAKWNVTTVARALARGWWGSQSSAFSAFSWTKYSAHVIVDAYQSGWIERVTMDSLEIQQPQWTEEEIRAKQEALAARKGMSVSKAYEALDRGDFHGTILESRLHMLRFLLGEELPSAAE